MIQVLFSVYDSKSLTYCPPFLSTNAQTAKRDFSIAVIDPTSAISKAPEDYTLYDIGTFDSDSGLVNPASPPVYICSALQFKEH
ncbi:MAG: nonstructural protein [Microviridae sp.]|nr:MAG: nonstructural protein [Microviridae sp.]